MIGMPASAAFFNGSRRASGFGAETAAPIVRDIMSRIYRTPCEGPELGEQED